MRFGSSAVVQNPQFTVELYVWYNSTYVVSGPTLLLLVEIARPIKHQSATID
jgi:hypothetical protein